MPGAIGNARGVDLNSANEQELANVGGIGNERAHDIVQHRPFRSWEEVKRIPGFSDTLVSDLQQAGATLGGDSRSR